MDQIVKWVLIAQHNRRFSVRSPYPEREKRTTVYESSPGAWLSPDAECRLHSLMRVYCSSSVSIDSLGYIGTIEKVSTHQLIEGADRWNASEAPQRPSLALRRPSESFRSSSESLSSSSVAAWPSVTCGFSCHYGRISYHYDRIS